MEDLIAALQTFLKYSNLEFPVSCSEGQLTVIGVHINDLSPEDFLKIDSLGFMWDNQLENFVSFRFGSA